MNIHQIGKDPIIQQPQAVPQKNDAEKLTERVQGLFILISNESIDESSLNEIHEPRENWKKDFLNSYRGDDLVGCANLLNEALNSCIQEAVRLKNQEAYKNSPHAGFLTALTNIGELGKTLLVSPFSKTTEPSTARDVTSIVVGGGPATFLSTVRVIKYGSDAGVLPWTSLASRWGGAALNIPGIMHITQAISLINDALEKNPWPAIVGGTAGLTTTVTLYGVGGLLLCTGAGAPLGAGLVALAPTAGLTAGATAANAIRGVQTYRKHKLKHQKRLGAMNQIFEETIVRKRRSLKAKIPLGPEPKRRRVADNLNKIFSKLPASEDINKFRKSLGIKQEAVQDNTDGNAWEDAEELPIVALAAESEAAPAQTPKTRIPKERRKTPSSTKEDKDSTNTQPLAKKPRPRRKVR